MQISSEEDFFNLLNSLFQEERVGIPEPVQIYPQEPIPEKKGLFCTKCEMDLVPINTEPRRVFYCANNKCERFGIVVVIAKTTKLN